MDIDNNIVRAPKTMERVQSPVGQRALLSFAVTKVSNIIVLVLELVLVIQSLLVLIFSISFC
jgi:hypothetical protein